MSSSRIFCIVNPTGGIYLNTLKVLDVIGNR